jgi:hypothetical protein
MTYKILTEDEFNALPDNIKRVHIAEDVIKQINLGKFLPQTGHIVQNKDLNTFLCSLSEPISLKDILPDYNCTVCAKGAMFLSDVLARNNYYADMLGIGDSDCERKLDYISKKQLHMIEAAFECRVRYFHKDLKKKNLISYSVNPNKLGNSCVKFGLKYEIPNARLIAIMENIIENEGEFRP